MISLLYVILLMKKMMIWVKTLSLETMWIRGEFFFINFFEF